MISDLRRSTGRQITVIFRYDDYSSRTDRDADARHAVFQELEIPCTMSVVPCITPLDEVVGLQVEMPLTCDKVRLLTNGVKSGLIQVALHGYSHQTILSGEAGAWTEFAGLDYVLQLQRIHKGKRMLERLFRVPVRTFVPPWNSYDPNTLRALEHLGFDCISGGKRGVAGSSCLVFMPATCGLFDLPQAIGAARASRARRAVIVALYHPDDLAIGPWSHQDLVQFLLWIKTQGDLRVRTIQQAMDERQGLSASEYERLFRSPTRRLFLRLTHQRLLFYPLSGNRMLA